MLFKWFSNQGIWEGLEFSKWNEYSCGMISVHIWRQYRRKHSTIIFCSVAQSCPTFCDPMHTSFLCPSPTPGACSNSMSIESVMPSNHLILCRPLFLLPSIFPSIRVISNESVLHIRWPKYWSSASASVLPMNIQDWFPLGLTGLIFLQSKGLSRVFNNTVQKHQFFSTQHSLWSNSYIHTWLLEKPELWLDGHLLEK